MKKLEFQKELDNYHITLVGAQGTATKNAMTDFTTKVATSGGAVNLANDKLRGWQCKMVDFIEAFSRKCERVAKEAS